MDSIYKSLSLAFKCKKITFKVQLERLSSWYTAKHNLVIREEKDFRMLEVFDQNNNTDDMV